MISKRTKEALAVAKVRGCRLGNPNPRPASLFGNKAWIEKSSQFADSVWPVINTLKMQGLSLREIASAMNRRAIKTVRGGEWYATTVRNILARDKKYTYNFT